MALYRRIVAYVIVYVLVRLQINLCKEGIVLNTKLKELAKNVFSNPRNF